MSTSNNPLGAVFELQRATIEQTGKLVEQSIRLPKQASESLGMSNDDSDEMQLYLLDSSRESVHKSLEAVESIQDEDATVDEFHDSVDALFDILDEHHEEAVTTYEQEYESVETDVSEAVEDNVETLLEAHKEFEDQLMSLFETVDEQGAQFAEQTTESTVDIDLSGSSDEDGDGEESKSAETDDKPEPTETDENVPDDEVVCRVCGDSFAAITHPHLQTHDMTIAEYREEFGDDVALRPDGDT